MNRRSRWELLPIAMYFLLFITACNPKISKEVRVEEVETKPKETIRSTPCTVFDDLTNRDEALEAHVLYRNHYRQSNYTDALPYWRKAYELAPAADGKRDYQFIDGIRIYKHLFSLTKTEDQKRSYWDTVSQIYHKASLCYPDQRADYAGLKAFDSYYTFSDYVDQNEIFNGFAESFRFYGDSSPAFVINPFTDVLIRKIKANELDFEEARSLVSHIKNSIENGLKSAKKTDREAFGIVNSYAPERLVELESIDSFYSCSYFEEKYFSKFLENPTDCEVIRLVNARLKWGHCSKESEKYKQLIEAYNTNCQVAPGAIRQGYDCLNNADYDCAIDQFTKAIATTDDVAKKAKYSMIISKIYYSHLRNFPESRKYALQAANFDSSDGEPYMLIGRLYASSGPLCGSGRGWNSQVVVWAAIDMWNKAKTIDASTASEATQMIRQYSQYMPSTEDIFQRPNMKEGDNYFIPCWIQRNTKIRAK